MARRPAPSRSTARTETGSLFRAGIAARLAGAAALSVLLWAAILWANA